MNDVIVLYCFAQVCPEVNEAKPELLRFENVPKKKHELSYSNHEVQKIFFHKRTFKELSNKRVVSELWL